MTITRPTGEQFRSTLWRVTLPPLLLLAALAACITLMLFELLRVNAAVQRSDALISQTYDIHRLLIDMETSLRGYLLTGRPEFLDPYNKARQRINPALDELKDLLRDSPGQAERASVLRADVEKWMAARNEMFATKPAISDVTELAGLEHRKQLMDQMRVTLQQMILSESDQRERRYAKFQRFSFLIVLAGIGISMSLGIGLAILNRRTITRLTNVYKNVLEADAASASSLEASNHQFLDLADAIPQLVWITDNEGKSVYYNGPWTEFTGSTLALLTERGWSEVLHADDQSAAAARWQESLRNLTPFEAEYRIKRAADGSYRWFLCRATPVRDKTGKGVRWFGACTDIDSQKQLSQQRDLMLASERAARSDLIRSSQIKDRFLTTLSHELRTPMTAILGWIRLLRDPAVRDTSLERGLDVIDRNARAQARLIEDLLDVSRILSGKLTLKTESVDLRHVVSAAIESLGPNPGSGKVDLVQRIDTQSDFTMVGDPARLQQVVWNLLSNAFKFTPEDGQVTVVLRRQGPDAVIVVSDTGRGMPPEFLPHAFERFAQAESIAKHHHGGLGLGLAIVKHLVDQHSGEVTAESAGEGRGATFSVRLPINRQALVNRAIEMPEHPASPATCAGLRILVVDDDRDTAEVVQKILETGGAIVKAVLSGSEALAQLNENRFDVLISDIGMPEMDGYDLIGRLRKSEANADHRLPAIALSAFARGDDRLHSLAAGYQMHVSKPTTPDELIRAVATVVSSSRDGAMPSTR